MENYSKYRLNYLNIINKFINGDYIDRYKIYEILWILQYKDLILWDDIPPDFCETFKIPHQIDYGVDGISMDLKKTCQIKCYESEKSRINWTSFSTFDTYSRRIINTDKMLLLTTNVAKVDKLTQSQIDNHSDIELIRRNFDELLESVKDEIENINFNVENHKDVLKIEEREYLLDCYDIFINSNNKNIFKFQLPCGVGKSYIIFYIIQQHKLSNKNDIHLLIVPWKDLFLQFIKNAKLLNINVGYIGNNECEYDLKTNDVIIVINHVENLEKIPKKAKFVYKFIDEAHHIENIDNKTKQIIDKIYSKKELHLSATFKNTDDIDYCMTLRDAINCKYICDYVFQIEYFTTSNITNELANLIYLRQLEWTPIFIYFNSTNSVIEFNELLQSKNVKSDYLTGDCNEKKRNKIIYKIKNNKLNVLVLCGVFNEGISIDNVKTIIFRDLRNSDQNRIQVSLRASRLCIDKPYFRIVLPIVENDIRDKSNKDIYTFMNAFFKIDPTIKSALKNHDSSRIKIHINKTENKNNEKENEDDAVIYNEEIYNSMLEYIGLSPLEKCQELINKVNEIKGIVNKSKEHQKYRFSDKSNMSKFWTECKFKEKCNSPPYDILLTNKYLKDDYEQSMIKKEQKLTSAQKCEELINKVNEIKGIVNTSKEHQKYQFSDKSNMGTFWDTCKTRQRCSKSPYDILLTNKYLKSDYDNSMIKKENKQKKLTPTQKCEELINKVNEIKGIVNTSNEHQKYQFSNGVNMSKFWTKCKSKEKCNSPPYDILLTNKYLKDDYEQSIIKKENKQKIK